MDAFAKRRIESVAEEQNMNKSLVLIAIVALSLSAIVVIFLLHTTRPNVCYSVITVVSSARCYSSVPAAKVLAFAISV